MVLLEAGCPGAGRERVKKRFQVRAAERYVATDQAGEIGGKGVT